MSAEALQRSTAVLIDSIKQTTRSFELLEKREEELSKKRSLSFGDELLSLGLVFYAGYRIIKTVDDAKQWWNTLKTMPPASPTTALPLFTLPLTIKPASLDQLKVLKSGPRKNRTVKRRRVLRRSSRRKES
jgi:hypothetical protein